MTSVITDGEIVTFSLGLLAAGNETTTNLIINSFMLLVDSPGIYEELRKEPNLILKAIEEVLRYRFPVTLTRRITALSERESPSPLGMG